MRISPLLLLAAATNAFSIPQGQADGVYEVSYHNNGTEMHQFIGKLDTITTIQGVQSAKFGKRQIGTPQVTCAVAEPELNHADTDAANSALDAQCGTSSMVGKCKDYYSIRNCVVAYACNLNACSNFGGDYHEDCRAADRVQMSIDITDQCGLYRPGWAKVSVLNSRKRSGGVMQYGYQDICTAEGANFCNRGIDG